MSPVASAKVAKNIKRFADEIEMGSNDHTSITNFATAQILVDLQRGSVDGCAARVSPVADTTGRVVAEEQHAIPTIRAALCSINDHSARDAATSTDGDCSTLDITELERLVAERHEALKILNQNRHNLIFDSWR
ncbi:hypothetical protein HDU83_005022 [Entophlyctis luteolus]|nr:hypothetical protein HDU83_005022 [Entophlyctis luteolus]